jgi:glutamate-1-semialdehyde 2,1-aminomutase
MITGFRFHLKGAQKLYDLDPDLSTFGKAMGNGFAIAALTGKREYMQLGDLYSNREKVFLLSNTHGAESSALAASLETMKVIEREKVPDVLDRQGKRLKAGINQAIAEYNLEDHFGLIGRHCCMVYFTRDQEKKPSQPFRTLFFQETMKRGLLAPNLIVSFTHSDQDIDRTVEAVAESLYVYRCAIDEGIEKYLFSRPVKPVMRKYN